MNISADKRITVSKRNHAIEFLRFVFCFLIINYHFFSHCLRYEEYPYFFIRGYMGDEFFFIVAGFFLSKSASEITENPVIWDVKCLLRKIRKIAVPYYITWCACFLGRHITSAVVGEGRGRIITDLANSVYELLFLEMFGFKKGLYSNDVGWFFSALLIVTFIIGVLIAKNKKTFVFYLAPLIALCSYGLLSLNYDYLHDPCQIIPNTFISKGLIRALAAICVGVFLEGIVQTEWFRTKINRLTGKKKTVLWIADIFFWIVIICYMVYPFSSNAAVLSVQYDYIVVVLMMLALLPVFSMEKTVDHTNNHITRKKIAGFLGKYSFYAYFGQAIFYSFDRLIYRMDISIFHKALILNLCAIGFSALLWIITEKSKDLISPETK